MKVDKAPLSNFVKLCLSELKFYETELKLVDLSTTTSLQISPPEEEYILCVRRDEENLVHDCIFNVFNPSFLWVWYYEKAVTSKDVIFFIKIPKANYSEFFTVLARFCCQIVRSTNFYIRIYLVLNSEELIGFSHQTGIIVEPGLILTEHCRFLSFLCS